MRFRLLLVPAVLALSAAVCHAYNAQDLIKDLREGNPQQRVEAAMRLRDFTQYPEVVRELGTVLNNDIEDPILRANCAVSIATVGSKEVLEMLETLDHKPDEKAAVRSGCIVGIATILGDKAIPELVERIKTEKNSSVRDQLEQVLTQVNDKDQVIARVSPLLRDEVAGPSAIRILGTLGGPSVVKPLAAELNEGRASTRRAVIQALGRIVNPESTKALITFYPNANEVEKVEIIASLSNQPTPASVQLMSNELENPKTFLAIRKRAALGLGTLKAQTGIKPLVHVLLNTLEDQGLRTACAQALGEFGDHDDDAIAGLIGALADKKVADEAAFALHTITHRYFGTDKDKWTEWFQKWRQERDHGNNVGH